MRLLELGKSLGVTEQDTASGSSDEGTTRSVKSDDLGVHPRLMVVEDIVDELVVRVEFGFSSTEDVVEHSHISDPDEPPLGVGADFVREGSIGSLEDETVSERVCS